MDRKTVVKVENVSMKFNLSSEKFDSFKEYIIKSIKNQVSYDEFWALKDISFEVMQGGFSRPDRSQWQREEYDA